MNKHPIFVSGVTRKTGSRVPRRLTDSGYPIGRGSRGAEMPFEWDGPDCWSAALRGVWAAFVNYRADMTHPEANRNLEVCVAEATAAGVRRFALISGRGESHTQLLVDIDHLATVIVTALTHGGYASTTYEVTGPLRMTFSEVADTNSEACSRSAQYIPISYEDFHAQLVATSGESVADVVTANAQERFDGRNAGLGHGVQRILGRPARDFVEFARRAAEQGYWDAPAASMPHTSSVGGSL